MVYRGLNTNVTPGGASPHFHDAGAIAFIQILRAPPDQAGKAIELLGRMAPVTKRLEPKSQANIYQAMVGGAASGAIIVFNEYPNQQAWAEHRSRIRESPDLQKLMPELAGLEGLTPMSNTLWMNVTPQ